MAQSQEGRTRDLRDAADAGMTLAEYLSWGDLWGTRTSYANVDDCGGRGGDECQCDTCRSAYGETA